MKITEIQFTNYKAFYGNGSTNKVLIPKGENLLIYGENGSGKSSIYEGLKNLFLASNITDGNAHFSRHLAVDEFINDPDDATKQIQQAANIAITLNDFKGSVKQVVYGTPGGNVETDTDVLEASKSNSFLSYRELLKTYLIGNVTDGFAFQVNLAELILKDILVQTTNIGTNKTYNQNYKELWVAGKGTRPSRAQKEDIAKKFDIGFKKDIADINIILNELLHYFFPELKIELSVVDTYIEYETQNYPVFQIALECWHYGIDTSKNGENHLTILNEARLSALALCIFLSGIIIKSKQSTKIKFLFFDDIFIGLDTSNRIPLLKILNEYKVIEWKEDTNPDTGLLENVIQKNADGTIKYKASPFFDDYQIFITTYDYNWFETAKYYLPNTKWETVEMYSHSAIGVDFDLPLIMSPSSNYYQKAEIYYKKSKDYKDYPASANYLRKEFEYQFKRLLYDKYLLKSGEKGTVLLREELGELRESFEQMLKDLAFDDVPFADLILYTKTTLNPLSHDNLSKPVFKRELQETFLLADKLIAINKELLIAKDTTVTLTTINGDTTRITTLVFSTDVFKYTNNGIHRHTPVFLKPKIYVEGDTKIKLSKLPECTTDKAYNMIYHSVFGTENASDGKNVNAEFVFEDGVNLSNFLSQF